MAPPLPSDSAPGWPRPHDTSQAPPAFARGLSVPMVLATCSRAGARLQRFPPELWVVPSAEAPLGQASRGARRGTRAAKPRATAATANARRARCVGTRERRARPSAGSRPDVSNRRPSGARRGLLGPLRRSAGDTFGVQRSPAAVLRRRRRG